jgi:hypothetical protein
MSTEHHTRHHRPTPWPAAEEACQEIWKYPEAFAEAYRRLCLHAAGQIERFSWSGDSAPDAQEMAAEALLDACKHEEYFWNPDENASPYWRSKFPNWPPKLHSLYRYLHNRIFLNVKSRATRDSNTKSGPPSAVCHADNDLNASEEWGAESLTIDHSGADGAGNGSSGAFPPDEELMQKELLQESWEVFKKYVHKRSFDDKTLIIVIADKIRSENLWQPALLADALHRPIQEINKAKTRLQSVLADMRADAFIETLPQEWQRLVKFLRDRVTSGRSLPNSIAEYAQANKVSEDEVGTNLNDIAQRKRDWSRRTHKQQIPLEVLGS